jgi:hypothetical protein
LIKDEAAGVQLALMPIALVLVTGVVAVLVVGCGQPRTAAVGV